MRREKSAGAVIFNTRTSKYLLLHYPAGHWDFPKGHIERGEDELKAARREVFEETGLEVEFLFGFREVIRYTFRERHGVIEKTVVFFLATTDKEDVRISYEHTGYLWLPYEEALEKITYGSSKKILMKAHLFLKNLNYVSR